MSETPKSVWIGRALSVLGALPFVLSSLTKLAGSAMVMQGFVHFGWPENLVLRIGLLEIACAIVYLVPQTAVLGAILLTGFLGGAIATHVRIGEAVYLHVAIGVTLWLGLFLREKRLAELLPVRGKRFTYTREITIARPSDAVFPYLCSLKNFDAWNPFIKKDPHLKKEYVGTDGQVGFVASWDGDKNVGAGAQEITRVIEGKRIEFELRFKRPFAATNTGFFAVEPAESGKTKVSWSMSGVNAFPMTVFGILIDCDKMIGKEFEAGLAELKTLLEK